jgi:hypothetical protein
VEKRDKRPANLSRFFLISLHKHNLLNDMFLILRTPIQYSTDERMGVAIAYTYSKWGAAIFGLIIFFFDENGGIQETIFIPFNDFGDEGKMHKYGRKIKQLLRLLDIPFGSVTEALLNLMGYCDEQSDWAGDLAVIDSVVGLGAWAAGMTNPVGWLLIITLGIDLTLVGAMWDNWRDNVFNFLAFIENLRPKG